MTKKFLSILLAAALMVFIAGCGDKSDSPASTTVAPETQSQIQATESGVDMRDLSLKEWSLEPTVWNDGNGVTVAFSVTPNAPIEGLRAALSVRIGELEAESTNCNWDGSAFTGSVDLLAADGYSYYCILFAPDGATQETELTSPENIVDETLVNMSSSLSAYANLIIEDWTATASTLTIKSGYVQCQMPKLTVGGTAPQIASSNLVLKLNNEEVARQALDIPAGEGEGSFEMSVVNQTFTIPAMESDHQLDLWLEITLNTGSTVSVTGGSWYSTGTELQMVVG